MWNNTNTNAQVKEKKKKKKKRGLGEDCEDPEKLEGRTKTKWTGEAEVITTLSHAQVTSNRILLSSEPLTQPHHTRRNDKDTNQNFSQIFPTTKRKKKTNKKLNNRFELLECVVAFQTHTKNGRGNLNSFQHFSSKGSCVHAALSALPALQEALRAGNAVV